MTTQDKELQALITNPDNLRAALEMEQQTALARREIAKCFSKSVEKIITNKINDDPVVRRSWRVSLDWRDEGFSQIWISTTGHKTKPSYRLLAEGVFTPNGTYGWVCWYRPVSIDMKSTQETTTLTAKMLVDGCSDGAEPARVARNNLRSGKRGYVLANDDDIVACHEDNQNPEHPLATEIADELWSMFTTYRTDIEALPSFQESTA